MSDRALALSKKAEYYRERAQSARKNLERSISSDDPDAIRLIKEKIEKLEEKQEMFKKCNKIARDKKLTDEEKRLRLKLVVENISDNTMDMMLYPGKHGIWGKPGFGDYELTNNNANIRRLKERLKLLELERGQETSEKEVYGVTVLDNVEENRLQLIFPSIPENEARKILKKAGFRWSPTNEAWQRFRGRNSDYVAKITLEELHEKGFLK